MKAIIYTKYGSPDVIQFKEVEKPTPKENEVLIKVHAASLNPLDWHFMRGTPYFLRAMTGLSKPKVTRLGVDVSGQVEAVGRNVTQFKVGDEVFGACRGAFAEYVCAIEDKLVMKPVNISFEDAAAVPIAAITALQGLRDKGRIQAGNKVLINGASGGVGTFAIQIAKWFGAEVTGVCSTRNVEMVRSIGADQVIDYTKEDFTKTGQRYDLFLDCFANHSLLTCRRILNSKGIYIPVGGPGGSMIGILTSLITEIALSLFVRQKFVTFITKLNKEDLTIIRDLIAVGKVKSIIDKRYGLSEVHEAIRYLEEGHARGKVIIIMGHNNKT